MCDGEGDGGVCVRRYVGESGEGVRPQPKDLLFFMRDKRSYSEIQEVCVMGEGVREEFDLFYSLC